MGTRNSPRHYFLCGGAPQPALNWLGKARGEVGALQHPSPRPHHRNIDVFNFPLARYYFSCYITFDTKN